MEYPVVDLDDSSRDRDIQRAQQRQHEVNIERELHYLGLDPERIHINLEGYSGGFTNYAAYKILQFALDYESA
jgi:hypothetical protein